MLSAPLNPNGKSNSLIVRRLVGNDDVTMRDQDGWVVDFSDYERKEEAALFEGPFCWTQESVLPHRKRLKSGKATETSRLDSFWLMQRPRPELRKACQNFNRVIVVPETSEHLLFRFVERDAVFSGSVFAIARDDEVAFGLLSSSFHRIWARALGNNLGAGNQFRNNATRTFATFPFPDRLTPNIPVGDYASDPRAKPIACAAARLNELRENWLNPADLVTRAADIVPGYPDRVLPKDEEAAKELKKRTLTNLYNAHPQWLADAHAALDQAVAGAYGWRDEWRAGMSDDDILARLFKLNQQRA